MKRGSLREKLVWIDTEKFRIPQGEWLQLLSKARYFFCTPGVHYPYCQNLNEATACGTVPFLQYPGFYRPMLETDSTCIAFREISEIETLLINALSEDNSHWQKLSSSVAQWHHNHMSLDYARDTIRAFLQNPEVKTMTWIMAGK